MLTLCSISKKRSQRFVGGRISIAVSHSNFRNLYQTFLSNLLICCSPSTNPESSSVSLLPHEMPGPAGSSLSLLDVFLFQPLNFESFFPPLQRLVSSATSYSKSGTFPKTSPQNAVHLITSSFVRRQLWLQIAEFFPFHLIILLLSIVYVLTGQPIIHWSPFQLNPYSPFSNYPPPCSHMFPRTLTFIPAPVVNPD